MEGRILLMLGLAVAATAMPPAQEELGYEEAVSLAIDLYNQEPGVAWAFRLLEAKPQPEWDPSIQSLQELEFTVQETTCPPSEQLNLDKCGFKADGVVKECHGTIISEQGAPVVQYLCETAGEGHIRVRRANRKVRRTRGRGKCGRRCRIKKPVPGGWSVIASVPNRRKHIVQSA
ncbi:PREDICTED: cathelicidin-1-like [Gekko japonicus]|uniref:Vipericidin n=1 Tax=Gekko japonicus TaxID=146911 RepID=A0ABM1KVV5_GEKJA|nr:PREDICTED: cathelicidin-1-like [Gekko japonicus]